MCYVLMIEINGPSAREQRENDVKGLDDTTF